MRVHQFAKAHGLKSADVLSAAGQLGLSVKSASSGLSAEDADKLSALFSVQASIAARGETLQMTPQESLFNGSPFHPQRLFKYRRRREVTLEEAIAACNAVGIDNAHRHRDLTQADINKLDAWFLDQWQSQGR